MYVPYNLGYFKGARCSNDTHRKFQKLLKNPQNYQFKKNPHKKIQNFLNAIKLYIIMKLLLENWRQYLKEDWSDTSWETDGKKITIKDIISYLGDDTVNFDVLELSQQLPPLPTRGKERVAAANLNYPIIVVKKDEKYQFILDGNHRLQKAIDQKVKSIKAKVLDLDSPETPEEFKKMFGGAE